MSGSQPQSNRCGYVNDVNGRDPDAFALEKEKAEKCETANPGGSFSEILSES
jgi:hypothetical protein